MTQQQIKLRSGHFALRIIKSVETLPPSGAASVIKSQLLRSGTSAGANDRACCRARSIADVLSRPAIVKEDTDESIYWIKHLVERNVFKKRILDSLIDEASQILSINVASVKTVQSRRRPEFAVPNPQ